MVAQLVVKRPHSKAKGIEVTDRSMSREFRLTAIATLVHLPLGLALYNAGPFAILHPLLVFGLGLVLAANRKVSASNVVLVAGYIVGSEVLWRMAHIPIYWESGKYMSAAILALTMFRRRRFRIPRVPAGYFIFLLPGCLISIANSSLSHAYEDLSFNMSGPFLLLLACWFFHNVRMQPIQLRRLIIAILLPLFSVAATNLVLAASNQEIQFTSESNFATSGGFGPNQVSSMLGLGVFLATAGLILFERRSRYGVYFAISALSMAALSVMTFSRGGIYNAAGGILALTIFNFREIAAGIRRVIPAFILAALFVLVIFPYLDSLTDGALEDRFEDTGTTNRWEIMQADLDVFLNQPIWGAGVGESRKSRESLSDISAVSHTEHSRLLSEHGIFGLAALFCLAILIFNNLKRPNSLLGKGFIAGAFAWSLLFMMNAGMRLAAPSFMIGMAFLTIVQIRKISRPNVGKIRLIPSDDSRSTDPKAVHS